MAFSPIAQQRALFALMCCIWGANWLALKAGTMAVPPALFSGTRWTVAGLILLGFGWARGQRLWIDRRLMGRMVLVAFLMVTLNATVLLYGMRYVGSGLAAVINSALTPISLLGFSVLLHQEGFHRRQLVAIALGVAGILLLFGPKAAAGQLDAMELLGTAGVIVACLSYSAGSVLARPLMRALPPVQMAALTNLLGGTMLLVLSFAFEPGAHAAMTGNWGIAAWAGWLYLLIPGSLGGTIIYFLLVRDWGASKTGTYAFVSPVIAVALGTAVYGERLSLSDGLGIALMLGAAGVALKR
jgi:drug/metabolite transporter (DMT)-like permease